MLSQIDTQRASILALVGPVDPEAPKGGLGIRTRRPGSTDESYQYPSRFRARIVDPFAEKLGARNPRGRMPVEVCIDSVARLIDSSCQSNDRADRYETL